MTSRRNLGFTLVELMIAVAIISVLAAIAVPNMQQYIVQAKVAEAAPSLRKIMDAAATYFYVDHVSSDPAVGIRVEHTFPATTDWYPLQLPVGHKITPAATDPRAADALTWNQLGFYINEPVAFHYKFESPTPSGANATAWVWAEAEIRPGQPCVLQRAASVAPGSTGELQLSGLKIISPP